MKENDVGTRVLAAALAVHRELGPGLLESVYASALALEMGSAGLSFQREVCFSARYRGVELGEAYRADFIVERSVVLELKAVEALSPLHRKQLLTYLRLTGCKLGYLLNFNSRMMKDGIERVVDGLDE